MAESKSNSLTMTANIDGNTFIRFALFDTFRLKKRWKSPVAFAAIMTGFAVICFAVRKTHDQAPLLGTVLLAAGLVLPAVWFMMYMFSVRNQVKKNGLSERKAQYFVLLGEEKIKVVKGQEEVTHAWDEVYTAYRVKGCIYLYMSLNRAYLLPDCDDTERAWETIAAHIPQGKLKNLL